MAATFFSFETKYHQTGDNFTPFSCQSTDCTPYHSLLSRSSPPLFTQTAPKVADSENHKRSNQREVYERALQKLSEEELPDKGQAVVYLQHKYRCNCKANTIRFTVTALCYFLGFLKGIGFKRLEDIQRKNVEAYVEWEQDRGLKINTVRTRLGAVYAFLRYLSDNHIVHPDILARKIKVKQPDTLPRAIDPEVIRFFLAVIDTVRDRALFLLLLRTGMRIGELLDLKISDISLNERKVLIYLGEKNSRGRVVYFSDDAREALQAWFRTRDPQKKYLFYAQGRERLGYAGARKVFKKYLRLAGLSEQDYSLHQLRHTFASELLNAGLRLEVLQQLLGHANLEITRRYARLTDKTREGEYFQAMAIIERGEIDGHY